MSKIKNAKFRTIELIIYEESTSYNALDLIEGLESYCTINGFRYYYITHDKDRTEGGAILKCHIHFLLYTTREKETTLKKLAESLGYSLDMFPVQYCFKNNIRESVKYLVHDTSHSQSKFKYDYNEIITNDKDYVLRLFNEDAESVGINSIIEYIDNRSDFIRYREISQFILDNNLWSFYRRNASIIKLLIEEHNYKLVKDC